MSRCEPRPFVAALAGVLAVAASAADAPGALLSDILPTQTIRDDLFTAQIFDPTPAI